jgi:hypothetical protein
MLEPRGVILALEPRASLARLVRADCTGFETHWASDFRHVEHGLWPSHRTFRRAQATQLCPRVMIFFGREEDDSCATTSGATECDDIFKVQMLVSDNEMDDTLYYQKFIVGDKNVMHVRLEGGVGRSRARNVEDSSVPKALAQPLVLVTTSGRSHQSWSSTFLPGTSSNST